MSELMTNDAYWEPFYKPFCKCQMCECDIREGDSYFDFDGDIVCEECESEYVKENFRRIAG